LKARILVGLQFGLLLLLVFRPEQTPLIEFSAFAALSIFLEVGAVVILLVAFVNLRPSLRISPIPIPGTPLIRHGIFKYFRHPMYLAVLMIASGILLTNVDLIGILICLALFVTFCVKADYEDKLLALIHKDALEYQSKTRGLPRLKNA